MHQLFHVLVRGVDGSGSGSLTTQYFWHVYFSIMAPLLPPRTKTKKKQQQQQQQQEEEEENDLGDDASSNTGGGSNADEGVTSPSDGDIPPPAMVQLEMEMGLNPSDSSSVGDDAALLSSLRKHKKDTEPPGWVGESTAVVDRDETDEKPIMSVTETLKSKHQLRGAWWKD